MEEGVAGRRFAALRLSYLARAAHVVKTEEDRQSHQVGPHRAACVVDTPVTPGSVGSELATG